MLLCVAILQQSALHEASHEAALPAACNERFHILLEAQAAFGEGRAPLRLLHRRCHRHDRADHRGSNGSGGPQRQGVALFPRRGDSLGRGRVRLTSGIFVQRLKFTRASTKDFCWHAMCQGSTCSETGVWLHRRGRDWILLPTCSFAWQMLYHFEVEAIASRVIWFYHPCARTTVKAWPLPSCP